MQYTLAALYVAYPQPAELFTAYAVVEKGSQYGPVTYNPMSIPF